MNTKLLEDSRMIFSKAEKVLLSGFELRKSEAEEILPILIEIENDIVEHKDQKLSNSVKRKIAFKKLVLRAGKATLKEAGKNLR